MKKMDVASASVGIRGFKVRDHRQIPQTRDSIYDFRYDIAVVGRLPSQDPSHRSGEWLPNRNASNSDENYIQLHLDA